MLGKLFLLQSKDRLCTKKTEGLRRHSSRSTTIRFVSANRMMQYRAKNGEIGKLDDM